MKNNKTKLIKIITTSLLSIGGLSVCAAAFLNIQQDKQTNAYSSPSTYYSSVNGKGQTLLESLYTKIRQDNNVGYDGLWDSYKRTDIRSDGKIYDLYSDKTMFHAPFCETVLCYPNILISCFTWNIIWYLFTVKHKIPVFVKHSGFIYFFLIMVIHNCSNIEYISVFNTSHEFIQSIHTGFHA